MLLTPLDAEAKAWLDENLDPDGMTWGESRVVEPRYVGPILEGFFAEGGEVTP